MNDHSGESFSGTHPSRFSIQALHNRLENKIANSILICELVVLISIAGASFYSYLFLSTGQGQFLILAGLTLSLGVAGIIGTILGRKGHATLGVWIMLVTGQLTVAISTLFVGGQGMWYAAGVILSTLLISSLTMTSAQSTWAIAIGILAALSTLVIDQYLKTWQISTPPLLSYFVIAVVVFLLILYLLYLSISFTNFTFRGKITVVVFGIAMISILILTIVNNNIYRSTLLTAANQTLLLAADRSATEIDAYLVDLISELEAIVAQSPAISGFLSLSPQDRTQDAAVINQMEELQSSLGALELVLLDRDGTVVFNSNYPDATELDPYLGLNTTDKNLIDITILSGAPLISSVLFPTSSQTPYITEPYFYTGVQITTREGNPQGILMAAYPAVDIQRLVAANINLAGEQSFGELVDSNYMRIVHSGYMEANFTLIYPLDPATFNRLQQENRIPTESSESITTNYPDYKAGLDQLYSTPFFETNEIGIGEDIGVSAGVRLDQKNWTLVFMQPRSAVFLPLVQQTRSTVLITGVVSALAIVVSALLAQLISRPIVELTKAAEKASDGDLSIEAPVISSDEIGKLSIAFNSMVDQLSAMLQGLEERVRERTADLFRSNEQLEYRASRLQMVAEVAHTFSAETDPNKLLSLVVNTISEKFGFYHVGIFRVDKYAEYAVLVASNSEGGRRMLDRGHRLRVGEEGLVGYVTHYGEARIALDVGADAIYFNNPYLPETRSEIALPLKVGASIIGALDVQSTMPKAFDVSDIALLSTLADQVAMAIENARLINDAQRTVRELERAQQQYIQQEWGKVLAERSQEGYHYASGTLSPIKTAKRDVFPDHFPQAPTVVYENPEKDANRQESGLLVPIMVRGQPIGLIELSDSDGMRRWGEDEISLAASIADQVGLALENARLLESTQRRAERERLVSEITTRLRATNDPQEILETAVTQLKQALKVRSVHVRVATDTTKDKLSDGKS